MKPRNILLIIPEMSVGGAQRSMAKLSIELAKDHRVWLCVFNDRGGIAYTHGGTLINLDVVPRPPRYHKFKSFIQRVTRLRKLKKQLKIDVSISFLEGADYVNILSKSTDKIVLSIRGSKRHDENMENYFYWLRNKILIPGLYHLANVVVAVNHGIAEELHSHYGLKKSKIVTIGNFYDIKEITRLSAEPKDENLNRLYQDTVLIITGRLAPEKGIKPLIQIFSRLKKTTNDIRLVMVGEGPSLHEVIEVCKELGLVLHCGNDFKDLPDVVVLQGQSNIFKYLKGATLFLMNSSSEGFPNGMAEAMICHVPVISSDCPYGPREMLAPEFPFVQPVVKPYTAVNGVLMPMIRSTQEVDVWIDTVRDMLKNEQLMMDLATHAYDRVKSFDREWMIVQWNNIVNDKIGW